jgi:hypothetical protein
MLTIRLSSSSIAYFQFLSPIHSESNRWLRSRSEFTFSNSNTTEMTAGRRSFEIREPMYSISGIARLWSNLSIVVLVLSTVPKSGEFTKDRMSERDAERNARILR